MAKFVISKKIILEKYNQLKNISNFVSYSSKTNPIISPILEENTDSLFSIHLENELKNIKDLGRVIFLAQGWDYSFINKLVNYGINNFVVDNLNDYDILVSFLKENSHLKPNVFFRIKFKENSIRTEKYFVFGIGVDKVNDILSNIDKNMFNKIGIHFHKKTQNMSEWNLIYDFENMIDLSNVSKIDMVNIGGGLPSEYANTNVLVINSIISKIKEFKEYLNSKNIQLVIEPGRFIAAPAGKLITQIISIYENNIIVDASVYNSDMDAIIVPIKLKVEGELESGESYVIKGKTPCSLDLFRYRVYLNSPKVGDSLVFLNAGAYNFSSDFCDLEKIETEIVE